MKKLMALGLTCFTLGMMSAPLSYAQDNAHRSTENVARDAARKPYKTLDFFGVKPSDKVVEILPGGGWYTEILAPMLKEQGELVAAHYAADTQSDYRKRSRSNYEKKLQDYAQVYGKVVLSEFKPGGQVSDKNKDADAVLVIRGLHGLQNSGDLAGAFVQFKQMLKSGGVLGVVQHQAPEGYDPVATARQGYLPKSHVIAVAKAAGFELESEAYFHNNLKDTIVQDGTERGVWALSPNLSNETEKARLMKVGESNRMTLLFRKP